MPDDNDEKDPFEKPSVSVNPALNANGDINATSSIATMTELILFFLLTDRPS